MAAERPRVATPSVLVGELVAGLILLAVAALGGLLLIRRPWASSIDAAGLRVLPANTGDLLYHRIADIGSLPFLLGGIALAIVLSIWRDFPRSVACAVGPVAAVLVTEHVAKPYVGRHFLSPGNSYPSGTVTAAAALVTVITLALPLLLRPVAAVAALGVIVAVSVAVVGMRWHYPTDAFGGACVGVGSVLTLDALVHLPRSWSAERARRVVGREPAQRLFASADR